MYLNVYLLSLYLTSNVIELSLDTQNIFRLLIQNIVTFAIICLDTYNDVVSLDDRKTLRNCQHKNMQSSAQKRDGDMAQCNHQHQQTNVIHGKQTNKRPKEITTLLNIIDLFLDYVQFYTHIFTQLPGDC